MFGAGELAGAAAAAGFEHLAKAAAQVQGQTGASGQPPDAAGQPPLQPTTLSA